MIRLRMNITVLLGTVSYSVPAKLDLTAAWPE